MSTSVGTTTPQQNREEIRFSPNTSGQYGGRIVGPVDQVRPLIAQLLAAGAEGVFIHDQSPNASIDFTFGRLDQPNGGQSPETPQLVYEFLGNEVEKDYLEADVSAVNALSDAERKLLRSVINGAELTTTQQASLGASATLVYSDLITGQKTVRICQPTIRISKVVSTSYNVKATMTNIQRIFSTAALTAAEGIPASTLFNLPVDSSGKANHSYGWFKKHPTVQLSGSRFSISQEYEYGLWSTTSYGALL